MQMVVEGGGGVRYVVQWCVRGAGRNMASLVAAHFKWSAHKENGLPSPTSHVPDAPTPLLLCQRGMVAKWPVGEM